MATTTPNFGWSVPTSSDLVKNGAVAIETLGDSIDASLVDLKGGTTGQVLAKASNTDMDFVWTADAGAPTSLGYAAGKNGIINGDFRVNQRAFTSVTTNGTFGFDRWANQVGSSGGTSTFTPQVFTPGAAPVAGYEGTNFARIVSASQSGANDYSGLQQRIEDVRTFAGQTVTVSFWAKAASGTPKVGVTFEQYFGAGGSSAVYASATASTISTSWARYSVTISVPSVSGKTINASSFLGLYIFNSTNTTLVGVGFSNTGLQNGTFDYWGVQVEAGSTATAFQTATGTIQGELAACQRYFFVSNLTTPTGAAVGSIWGQASSTSLCFTSTKYPVSMRVAPSVAIYNNNVLNQMYNQGGSTISLTSPSLGGNTQQGFSYISSSSPFGAGINYMFDIQASAEL
jgi:hypothetical protein